MQKTCLPFFLVLFFLVIGPSSPQSCPPSNYFNSQRCVPCKQNCQCSQQNGCSSCLPGYTFDSTFTNCVQCPVQTSAIDVGCAECCSQIGGTGFVCSKCPSGSDVYLLGGQCVKVEGCSSIDNNGRCSVCRSGYFLRDGACVACDASCTTCVDSTWCTGCATGYYNSTNGNYANCISCPTGCSTCSSSTSCSACLNGYRLAGSLCTACSSPTCLQCTASACTQCQSGYALVSGSCQACSTTVAGAGCLVCSNTGGSITCSKCADGYYLTLGNVCASCNSRYPNSVLCTINQPLQCLNDYSTTLTSRYYLINGMCVQNTKRCKSIKNTQGDCSSCYFQPGSYYQLSGNTCTQCTQTGCQTFSSSCQCLACQNGYQFVNQQCVACQNLNCYVCQSDVRSCQVCAPYYGLISSACIQCVQGACLNCDGDSNKCVSCLVGYYNSGGTCYRCQASCDKCVSATVCTACQAGHYLTTSGRCKSLPTNCVEIDSNGNGSCLKCRYGYMISSGACVPCSMGLFNLGSCQRYCPSYYSQLKFQGIFNNFGMIIFFMIGMILVYF